MSENGDERPASPTEQQQNGAAEEDPYVKTMREALEVMRQDAAQHEEEIQQLKAKQAVRLQRRATEMERLEAMRKAEEQRRREEEAEKKRIKDEEKERKRKEKERIKKEKEDRAKNIGKKNFTVKKSEKSSLDMYEQSQEQPEGEMTKSKEQLEEEKRVALSQRIIPLDLSGKNTDALIAKAKELHSKLYQLESDKYDLEDRFKRQQYDMMELAERARQMNKGGRTSAVKVQDEPSGPCPGKGSSSSGDGGFDRLAEKFPNVPPRVEVANKHERNIDRRNFFEKMGVFERPKVAVCSKYDRQTDKRNFSQRRDMFLKAKQAATKKQEDEEEEE